MFGRVKKLEKRIAELEEAAYYKIYTGDIDLVMSLGGIPVHEYRYDKVLVKDVVQAILDKYGDKVVYTPEKKVESCVALEDKE